MDRQCEDQVGLGKILTAKCPYSDAIEAYKTGSEKLKQIGLLEQSMRLNEGLLLWIRFYLEFLNILIYYFCIMLLYNTLNIKRAE